MNHTRMAVLAVGTTLCLQGCILAPNEIDSPYDPFFFDPQEQAQSAEFSDSIYSLDAADFSGFEEFTRVTQQVARGPVPQAAKRACATDLQGGKVTSPCWFFPVMRVY